MGGAAVGLKAYEFVDENGDTQFDCSHLALAASRPARPLRARTR